MISRKFKDEKPKLRATIGKLKGVAGIGLGKKVSKGKTSEELSVRVYVRKKVSDSKAGKNAVPKTVKLADGTVMKTDVVEIGDIKFKGFTGRYRPAQPGAVIGADGATLSGTFGARVTDNTDGKKVLLSCNHVLAEFDALPVGTEILQPSTGFGGASPDDVIGTLKRAVPMDFSPLGVNYVDAAIAKTNRKAVKTRPFCSAVKPGRQGAVGMLFAASSIMTIINPSDSIATLMNVTFPKTATAAIGMSIHACCAISGYVSTTISDVMVDLLLVAPNDNDVWFMDQVICAGGVADGFAGDSGAMFYTTYNV